MNKVSKDIFKAIHEGKWLSIEYRNRSEKVTRYWIGIKDLDIKNERLTVDGLHLSEYTRRELKVYIKSILSSSVIDGSYYAVNQKLIDDIKWNRHKYNKIFQHSANLKILNYLADCNRLDTTPYRSDYTLIKKLDSDRLMSGTGTYQLSDLQFREIVSYFQMKTLNPDKKRIRSLAMNVLSVHTRYGLYVLAYRELKLDVAGRTLRPEDEITICREFTINGDKQSIRMFLDADDYALLDDFEKNQEYIKDLITQSNPHIQGVDDLPYIMAIGRDIILDLENEYEAIIKMYEEDSVTYPIRSFFGEMVRKPGRRKEYPLALLNQKVNIDQLLAINNAIKYPVAYIQGPPGTGKTSTILNTIITAFFNEKSVLFASYNNHPIDSVFQSLTTIRQNNGKCIPFPVVRLGNNQKVAEALEYMKALYEQTKNLKIYKNTLERNKDGKIERTRKLTELLKRHEEYLTLIERREVIQALLTSYDHLTFTGDLHGRQLAEIEHRLQTIGRVTDSEATRLLTNDEDEFMKYLYYTSASYIKKLGRPQNEELLNILYLEEAEEKIKQFNRYISKEENLKKFMKIFPIVATTCISAHKLGEPKPYFDMVIIDEASQCNTALSLVPVIRGESLMLVGDPQQLNPVILLDPKDNLVLMKKYGITKEYDYIENSVYKAFLASDPVCDEVLLSYHYRCHEKIIVFNNKKYYNSKLNIKSQVSAEDPLLYIDVKDNHTDDKNVSPAEADKVIEFVKQNRTKKIGVITPFIKQKQYINERLKVEGFSDVTCGTVHAFQGDEKDIILFSTVMTDQMHHKTYGWLKNNKELINVATSRAKEQLVVLSSLKNLERLHSPEETDDVYELVHYVKNNGVSQISERTAASRALGVKPYSTETEEAFFTSLKHALDNVLYNNKRCRVYKEVAISQVFGENKPFHSLFYTGRFDFVVYERAYNKQEYPILAIELDGKEHVEDEVVKSRDHEKNMICREHGFELIRIENSYARRYHYIKEILSSYFQKAGTG